MNTRKNSLLKGAMIPFDRTGKDISLITIQIGFLFKIGSRLAAGVNASSAELPPISVVR